MSESACQCYLLAAGRGKRAGGAKAWRDCDGMPLLARQLEFLGGIMPLERVAVSIQVDWAERCRSLSPRPQWVAVDPDAPALDSVLALARALPLDRWTFLYHVDMRVWEQELFRLLERGIPAAQASGDEALIPVHDGRGGHPVLLSPGLKTALAALDPSRDRLDVWLRSRRAAQAQVPYPCIHDNWNT